MRHPKHVSQAADILYVIGGGALDRERIQSIVDNYNWADLPEEQQEPTQIRAISYDGSLRLGAWVNCDVSGEWQWVYLAAGDEVNKQMIALEAGKAGAE